MTYRSRSPFSIVLPALLVSAATSAYSQSITGIGFLPAGQISIAAGISPDGLAVAGFADAGAQVHSVLWTRAAGLADLGTPPGQSISRAFGVSNGGDAVIGYAGTYPTVAVRWTSGQGLQSLGVLPGGQGGQASAWALSPDGSVVVGESWVSGHQHAFRWTASNGMVDLAPNGPDALATGISGNGVIVGARGSSAFRWTQSGGLQDLGLMNGWSTYADGVSADGLVVVGSALDPATWGTTFLYHAVRWSSPAGYEFLGILPGAVASIAYSCNADGSIIVGDCKSTAQGQYDVPFVWTRAGGISPLETYLASHGVDLTGWQLGPVHMIDPSGRVLVGEGHHNGVLEGWIAEAPICGSADFNHDGDSGTDADIEAFFACIAGTCCPTCDSADFNGDGDSGTDADIEAFFRVLAGGAC